MIRTPRKTDLTARAAIRDEALRLYADRGPDAVSLREVAAGAGVSQPLVAYHFGSKQGLQQAVDEYVLGIFDEMLHQLAGLGPDLFEEATSGSFIGAVLDRLPAESPVPAYLRRLLMAGEESGHRLFGRLFETTTATLQAMTAAGLAAPGADPAVRAAFLLANDLAVLLMRDQLTRILGTDPLSPAGLTRWTREMMSVYAHGLKPADPSEPAGSS